jgi:putative copper export protein
VIFASLQGWLSFWEALAIVFRALVYATTLGTAGLMLFAVGFGHQLPETLRARLRGWILGGALLGIAISAAALVIRMAVLTEGESFTDATIWGMMMASPVGHSFYLSVIGLALAATFAARRRAAPVLAVMSVLLVVMSYAAIGHSLTYEPRLILAALLVLHLLAVLFWVGSLPPLAWAARHDARIAAPLIKDWARIAQWIVGGLVLSGLIASWYLVGGLNQLLTTPYGWAKLAKVALVGVMLGFAAWHKLWLTPALNAGAPGSGERFARSIWIEAAVALAVFLAVAELVAVSPEDYGHLATS